MNLVTATINENIPPYNKGEIFNGFIQLMVGCDKVGIFKNSSPKESPKYKLFDNMDTLKEFMSIDKIQFNNGHIIDTSEEIEKYISSRLKFRELSINY